MKEFERKKSAFDLSNYFLNEPFLSQVHVIIQEKKQMHLLAFTN
ncbi:MULTISPECIES: hypothetical protein [Flavobacterium]|nr:MULTISPECIES: hypothetical protein [Flavobacterium]